MKLQVYSVLDLGVKAYLPPFYVRARGEALRSFDQACKNPDSQFGRYPDQYILVYLGEFDDVSGLFGTQEPERILSAMEMIGSVAS